MLRVTKQIIAIQFVSLLVLSIPSDALAHFIWVYQDEGKVKVVFGESLEPDQESFLKGLDSLKAFNAQGKIKLTKKISEGTGWLETDSAFSALISCDPENEFEASAEFRFELLEEE